MKRNQGFTIIELVVVIVLLGILAATALPRFINLSDDARSAANKGIGSALQSGVNLARTTRDVSAPSATSLTNFGGSTGATVYFGTTTQLWPVAGATTLPNAFTPTSTTSVTVATPLGCAGLFAAVLANNPNVSTTATTPTTGVAADYTAGVVTAGGPTCTFTRTDKTTDLVKYDITSGVVSTTP